MVEYLIGKGVSPSARDGLAIVDAAWNGHQSMVEYLIGKGISPDAQDGWALVNAAGNGHQSTVEYLIGKGADIELAIGTAQRCGNFRAFQVLQQMR